MARDFNGTTDRLDWANVFDATGQPMSVLMWVYPDVVNVDQQFLDIHTVGDGAFSIIFWSVGSAAVGALGVSLDAATVQFRHGTGIISAGSWQHIGFTWDGTINDATTIKVYHNGSEIGYIAAQNGVAPQVSADGSYALGGRIFNDNVNYNGRMQEVGIWDHVLSDDEMAILGDSYSPLFVPENLEFYSKLIRRTTELNIMSGALAAHDGTTVIQHSPMLYPSAKHISHFAAGAPPGVSIPVAMIDYRIRRENFN